jgi:hypothetical protein
MIGSDALVALLRNSQGVPTLSVYIDGRMHDPAMRTRWRTELQHALDAVRPSVPDSEHAAFASALKHLERELTRFDGAVGAPGYVAFVNGDGVLAAELVAAAMPTVAMWGHSAQVTPYVKALAYERPVFAVVAESREARLYQWLAGELTMLEVIEATDHRQEGEAPHRARTANDGGGHRNVRGATGADELQRLHDAEINRLVHNVVASLSQRAGTTGSVVVSGAKDVAPKILHGLPKQLADRSMELHGIGGRSTPAEIREAVGDAAAQLRQARDAKLVAALVERAHKHARARIGLEAVASAIDSGSVGELLLTEAAWSLHPEQVEGVVAGALLHGGVVELVEGDAATTLDAEGGGVGALLRFEAMVAR